MIFLSNLGSRAALHRALGNWGLAGSDLTATDEIADRSGLKLFQIESVIERARLTLARDGAAGVTAASGLISRAKALIEDTHTRDHEGKSASTPSRWPGAQIRIAVVIRDKTYGHESGSRTSGGWFEKQSSSTPQKRWQAARRGPPEGLTANIKACIMAAFNDAGGKDYLVKVAKTDPRTFCTLLGKLLPTQVTGDAADEFPSGCRSHGCRQPQTASPGARESHEAVDAPP